MPVPEVPEQTTVLCGPRSQRRHEPNIRRVTQNKKGLKQSEMADSREPIWREWEVRKTGRRVKKLSEGSYGAVFRICDVGNPFSCMAAKPSCDTYEKCVREKKNQFELTSTEANTSLALTDLGLPGVVRTIETIQQFPGGRTDSKAPDAANIYMELVAPFEEGISTLHNLYIRRGSDPMFLNCLAQVFHTIVKIRESYPLFRHNDLHGSNVMVTRWQAGARVPPRRYGDVSYVVVPFRDPRAVIVDFGKTVGGLGLMKTDVALAKLEEDELFDQEDLGWGSYKCEWYDAVVLLTSIERDLAEYWKRVLDAEVFQVSCDDPNSQNSFRNPENMFGFTGMDWPARPTKSFMERLQRMVDDGQAKTLAEWMASSKALGGVPVATASAGRKRRRFPASAAAAGAGGLFSPSARRRRRPPASAAAAGAGGAAPAADGRLSFDPVNNQESDGSTPYSLLPA